MSSSRTGRFGERATRPLLADDVEEVGHVRLGHAEASERIHVHDPQARSERPVLERVGGLVADPLHHQRRHRLERRFGLIGVHLVEVHEPGIAAGRVLVGRDHAVARNRGFGDVPDVHEVGPVTQLLRALRFFR